MRSYHQKVMDLMAVDDFDTAEIGRAATPAIKPTKKKTAARKKSKAKKTSKKKKIAS